MTEEKKKDFSEILASPEFRAALEKIKADLKDGRLEKNKISEPPWRGLPEKNLNDIDIFTHEMPHEPFRNEKIFDSGVYRRGAEIFNKILKDYDLDLLKLSPEERARRLRARGHALADAFRAGASRPVRPMRPLLNRGFAGAFA